MKFTFARVLLLLAVAAFAFSACRNEANRIPETCFDGVRNQGETAVDCGGPNCPECLPTCDDRIYNQDEFSPVSLTNPNAIGIDCGGENCPPCSTCDDGIQNAHWVFDANLTQADLNKPDVGVGPGGILYRLVMETGIDCGFPCDSVCAPRCDDGILNGQETGKDCGGPDCPPCAAQPNCFDGIQNGQETGIDCGSIECPISQQACPAPNCMDGIMNIHIELTNLVQEGYVVVIEAGIDCDFNPLTSCPDCPLPTCFDGIMNGNETGVDCGGSCITECNEVPSCWDGVQNGGETGVDCGGPCAPCATCYDNFQNGPELGPDCLDYPIAQYTDQDGGPCPLCPSCHDGIQTESLFELDIDCGGPNCESCLQYLTAESIGVTVAQGTGFTDQFSYNRLLALAGLTDTLFVPNALKMDNRVQTPNGHYRIIRGIQRIEVPNNGTYERVLEIFVPTPTALVVGAVIPVVPKPLAIINAMTQTPTISYREGFINGPFTGMKTFDAVAPDVTVGDPTAVTLTIDYNYANLAGALIEGRINFMRLRENTPINPEFRVVSEIAFAIQFNPFN